ncbi:hypothetical protein M8J77_007009 [Diaphorina citri]|nr:hypothetical protein M8J77_007009 [Diaphorina citri]
MEQNPDDLDYRNYHSILPHEYPLFQNYQLIGDSQLVRFSELFLNCKRQYLSGSSGRVGYCIGGQRAEQLCQHLTLKTWPVYKNVILLIGTNDIKDSTDVSQWKESVKKIVDLFVSYNVQSLILLTVPPIPKLWHHVQHWTLFIEYNEFLFSLEKKYKDSFSSLKLIDISSIFLTNESDSSESNKLNLYVISPARDGIDYYDEEFMMTNFRKHKFGTADSTEMKDNSYLKQNISLFDTMNMRYKLMSCFRGNTNDQDISINRERFDLIGVTLNDVWNIKCNILNIGNEEYMYSLRHAFQKFLSHLHQEPQRQRHKRFSSGDISAWSVPESPIPSKIPRGECPSFEDNEHDLSGVYCRSFEGSSEKQATSKSGEKKEPNAASIPSLRQVKRPTRELYQVQTSAKIALLSKHGNIDESGKSANENKIQYDPSMQGISVTLDNQKNTSVTKIKTTLGRETISKFTPRQVILNKTRERMSHSSGTTESDTSSETIDSANDKEGLSKTYEDVNKNYNTPYTKMNTSTDSLNSALDTILPGDTSRRNVEPSNSELEVTQSAEERFILNIDYLTSEEKALMELKQSKKETIFHREKAHSGYDRLFLLRSNTIQFFQYVQAVCQYNSNYDINPIDERVFYSQIRTLRSPSAYELESKFYTSMLGRFEFYKFIKYISLNYVVPKMFSNQFKNVIFTSLLDKNSNCANYIIRNLDLSVYETHFSRLPSTPLNKSPKVDLIHLNEKGFELLKNCLTQAITQIRRESNF